VLAHVAAQCAEDVQLQFTATDAGLRSIHFPRTLQDHRWPENGEPIPGSLHAAILAEAVRQLCAYFAGELRQFTLPLDPQGTGFQKRVWTALQSIPFGEVRSYTDIARAIDAPLAVRAVGAANGANPLPIVIPCHRVIGASGKLVGYGGGLTLKKRLLELEGCNIVLFRS
jgi:methylated-DNA-[protein]-cysteine S-methyltransferase